MTTPPDRAEATGHTQRTLHSPWPYPRWIAHRGAGQLAPENTLAAFRVGAAHGYRMFECDVKLSADGVPFLLHDSTLARTTLGVGTDTGTAGDHIWGQLSQLDAGGWHSRAFAGEPLPTLAGVASFCQANGYLLNIEIKPTPGREVETGRIVALAARALWHQAHSGHPQAPSTGPLADVPAPGTGAPHWVPPLLTSFSPSALAAAQAAAPELPRGLLLETLVANWLEQALALGCVAVVAHYPQWTATTVRQAQQVGLRTLGYTVNDPAQAQRLLALGLDGLITDRVDLFAPGR